MPVEDIVVHHKVRKTTAKAGCFDSPRHKLPCRQVGRRFNGVWVPLDECLGCKAEKDVAYISKSREMIDQESAKYMKADQRLL